MLDFIKNKKASVLLLALLMMSGMIMAGLGLGTLVVNEIKQARNIDNSVIAFYMADLGGEESLYHIRKTDEAFTEIKNKLEPEKDVGGGKVQRKLDDSEPYIFTNLKENEDLYIDLYDPDNINSSAGIKSINLTWQNADDCGLGSAGIEFNYIEWTPGSSLDWDSKSHEFIYLNSPAAINSFSPAHSYQIRIKALNCGVKNLQIEAHNSEGNMAKIPNRIVIKSIGSFEKTKQAIKVIVPRKSPLSGLYDYILFSEKSLIKEIY